MPSGFKLKKYFPQQNTPGVIEMPAGLRTAARAVLVSGTVSIVSLSTLLNGVFN